VRPAGRAGPRSAVRCRSRRGAASKACSDDLSSVSGCHRGGEVVTTLPDRSVVRSARSATTGPYCWEASTLINLAELGNKAARRSGSLPEAGSLLRHPFLAVSTGGTTGIPKSAVRNQLSYAACTLNYLAVGGCTAATSAPGTPTATHTSSSGRKMDVRKTGICCVAGESTCTLTGDRRLP
jgi:hypothetical protein